MAQLSISNIINVSVAEAPAGLAEYNVNNLALFTEDQFLSNPDTDAYRSYISLSDVGNDFGTETDTYAQAAAVFSQNPNILNGDGELIIFPVNTSTAGQLGTVGITAAGTGYAVNDILTVGGAGTLGTLKVTAVSGSGQVLEVEIVTRGSSYVVASGVATTVAPSGGTGCTIHVLSVLSTETLAQAIARCKELVFFVGIISTFGPSGSDRKTLADTIQGYGNKIWFLPSATLADIEGVFTDIMEAEDTATRCLYYSTDMDEAYLYAAAYASRGMSVNFDASNGTLTMNLKQLATILPDDGITQSVYNNAKDAGVDIYPSFSGSPRVASFGANHFFDEVYNLIWFVASLQVAGFNSLATVSGKLPQTESGMSQLKGAYRAVCDQAVNNGYVAPGTWTSAEKFGNTEAMLATIAQRGFYIYSAPVASQSTADRDDRKAPLCQIAIKQAGAIQSSDVIVYINR